MREKKFTRIAAFLLCLTMLLGNAVVFASASENDDSEGSITDVTLEELRELLNAITYEEYSAKYANVANATTTVQVPIAEFDTKDPGFKMEEKGGVNALYTPQNGSVSWTVNIPETAKYAMKIEYYPDQNRATSIERILKINDEVPFAEARFLTLPKRWVNDYVDFELDASLVTEAKNVGYNVIEKNGKHYITFPDFVTEEMTEFADEHGVRFFQRDITNNELRPTTTDEPDWMTYYLKDSSGYYTDNFAFMLEKGETKITLEGQNEPMSIKAITLYPLEDLVSYDEYAAKYAGKQPGQDKIKIEAELAHVMSNKTIYPVEDRSCAVNSPTDVTCTVLNTVGGEKWATAGQWVEYRFKVNSSGMYDMVSRFRQNILDGMYTCRSFYIYSEGLAPGADGYYNGAPFEEALKLVYSYDDAWQVTQMSGADVDTNGDGEIDEKDTQKSYSVYLEKDVVYTIRYEVTLGLMGDVVRRVEDVLNSINTDYLNIIKLTGLSPDAYRDYGFSQVMPDTMVDMVIQSRALYQLEKELTEIAGEKSSNAATLEKVARLLEDMGTDDDEVAKNLTTLKGYIGTLGTFLSDAQTQPLQLDYIMIQPAGTKEMPAAEPTFFQSLIHEVLGFFQSFVRDYNNMGALVETEEGSAEVWMASARDQFLVVRNLVNNDFTPNTNVPVDLKLVAGGTLLPSILSGSGPDVYLGLVSADVINYAIRSALLSIEHFEDFDSYTKKNFNEAAMIVLGIEDADEQMHYYGLPEAQTFAMMFVRIDIMADLGLEIPRTWDDIMSCIPTLQANNMQIGLPTDFQIFLYQQGGELFADDGMRINLDSKVGLASFEKMCNLFTMYSFPYQYDGANRFRTGEMPIIIGDYVGFYNQLKVFATEINGKWEFMPMPGEIDAEGNVNNVAVSGITATVMVKGCDQSQKAWEFMKWYNGENFQVEFTNEMVAIMGPSAKQAVSNRNALASLPWTTDEYEQIQLQFNNLASIPNYPGAYIIARYTNFAFLSAYNDNMNPSDAMLEYVPTINKEIERKRNEFMLETLTEDGVAYKDKLTKRLAQILALVEIIRADDEYKGEYADLMTQVERAAKSDDAVELELAAEAVETLYKQLDPDGSIFVADRIEVMGYDMTDTSLTKNEKKKLRNCFSYEVYKNTDKLVTQLKCLVDFLEDAAAETK